ncbi:hypothetical protein B0189_03155 [Moraxella cuniculi]|nr:hypothetical protein B0189_03155 [Moraxella cuniculi]
MLILIWLNKYLKYCNQNLPKNKAIGNQYQQDASVWQQSKAVFGLLICFHNSFIIFGKYYQKIAVL